MYKIGRRGWVQKSFSRTDPNFQPSYYYLFSNNLGLGEVKTIFEPSSAARTGYGARCCGLMTNYNHVSLIGSLYKIDRRGREEGGGQKLYTRKLPRGLGGGLKCFFLTKTPPPSPNCLYIVKTSIFIIIYL